MEFSLREWYPVIRVVYPQTPCDAWGYVGCYVLTRGPYCSWLLRCFHSKLDEPKTSEEWSGSSEGALYLLVFASKSSHLFLMPWKH